MWTICSGLESENQGKPSWAWTVPILHTHIHKSNNKIISQDDSDLGYGDSLTYYGRNEF